MMPIPDSARPCAQQLAQVLGLPYREGFIKKPLHGPYLHHARPDGPQRKSVRQKLNAMPVEFEGKSVLLVDDSIVRGTQLRETVDFLYSPARRKCTCAPPARRSCTAAST